jgi:cytochrome c oxidase assembly protein subunit 11
MKDPTKNNHLIYFLTALTMGMLGASFAAVPLYRLICQKTGFGGTPQVGLFNVEAPKDDHYIRVQFTASTHRDLPWHFIPKQHETIVKIGEPKLVFYQAENRSHRPIIGMATYNVSPDKAGIFFGKIQCFCFEQQRIEPGQILDMPVLFTVSPDILKDPLTKDLKTLTLSYTFFEYRQ